VGEGSGRDDTVPSPEPEADVAAALKVLALRDTSPGDPLIINLRHTDLRSAELQRTNLSGAHLFEADLTGAYLAGADLTGAQVSVEQVVSARPGPSTVLPEHIARDATVQARIAEVEQERETD
jgi:hypothetical protein